jgi:hypothetical protein
MRVMSFHLMPYAPLDIEAQKQYRSAWVVLPNSHYDPKVGHELYNRYLDELELAAELGFDGVCINEHHQTAYGLMPSPVVMASALSRRIKTAKIAILGNAFCHDRRDYRWASDNGFCARGWIGVFFVRYKPCPFTGAPQGGQ